MGAQSLDDNILVLNRRGHTVADTLRATALLRAGGFKIVLHWMPNLLGATPDSDREDFTRLWQPADQGAGFCPDEIKIYPTQLLKTAELYQYWERGEYHPYNEEDLIQLVADVKAMTPRYCRINRVIRDIPSINWSKAPNAPACARMPRQSLSGADSNASASAAARCAARRLIPTRLTLDDLTYKAANAEEHFLSFVTPDDRLAGYLRLSFPADQTPESISRRSGRCRHHSRSACLRPIAGDGCQPIRGCPAQRARHTSD